MTLFHAIIIIMYLLDLSVFVLALEFICTPHSINVQSLKEQHLWFDISLPNAEVRTKLVVSTVTQRRPSEGNGGSTCSPDIIFLCSEEFNSLTHDSHCADIQDWGQSCLHCSFMHPSMCSQVCFDVLCLPFYR